jgi:hypothetical protein
MEDPSIRKLLRSLRHDQVADTVAGFCVTACPILHTLPAGFASLLGQPAGTVGFGSW